MPMHEKPHVPKVILTPCGILVGVIVCRVTGSAGVAVTVELPDEPPLSGARRVRRAGPLAELHGLGAESRKARPDDRLLCSRAGAGLVRDHQVKQSKLTI